MSVDLFEFSIFFSFIFRPLFVVLSLPRRVTKAGKYMTWSCSNETNNPIIHFYFTMFGLIVGAIVS
ncbi:hypothetical protein F4778DRAFT_727607 [Xylariomycetidae sp. FL2044]|nr:hypothetical protein F4778DRAFT_727607 [Xylariomycetidae sp. FL2044]